MINPLYSIAFVALLGLTITLLRNKDDHFEEFLAKQADVAFANKFDTEAGEYFQNVLDDDHAADDYVSLHNGDVSGRIVKAYMAGEYPPQYE